MFVRNMLEKLKTVMALDVLDDETTKMVQMLIILRLSTKHINLWARQLEMKRREKCELGGLLKFEAIVIEIEEENNLERWSRRCTIFFKEGEESVLRSNRQPGLDGL